MSDHHLSDCIRSTPSRTVAAILLLGCTRLGAVMRRSRTADPFPGIDERTLADIGLPRCAAFVS